MLGMRYANGKIAKNEYYTVEEFIAKLKQEVCMDPLEISFWDKLTNSDRYKEHIKQQKINEQFNCIATELIKSLVTLIEKDEFGRSTRQSPRPEGRGLNREV
jgi:hypothetical protein